MTDRFADPLRVREIAVALVVREGKVLVGRRQSGRHLSGFDEFPGGHREPGECMARCAERETLEETGWSVSAERLLVRRFHADDARKLWLWFFACRPVSAVPEILLDEGPGGHRWIAIDEIRTLRLPPANRSVLGVLRAGLAKSTQRPS